MVKLIQPSPNLDRAVLRHPLNLDLFVGVTPGLKLDGADLNIQRKLVELHLAVGIEIDSFAEPQQTIGVKPARGSREM